MSQRTSNLTGKPATVVVGGALINELGLMGAKMTHAQNEEIFGEAAEGVPNGQVSRGQRPLDRRM
jgi:hypothetical protein